MAETRQRTPVQAPQDRRKPQDNSLTPHTALILLSEVLSPSNTAQAERRLPVSGPRLLTLYIHSYLPHHASVHPIRKQKMNRTVIWESKNWTKLAHDRKQ